MSDRGQLEKNGALWVRRLLSRFLKHVGKNADPNAREVVPAWELRRIGWTPDTLLGKLPPDERWEYEYVPRSDYYVFRRPRPQRARPLRIAYREPEGRWISLTPTPRAENRP